MPYTGIDEAGLGWPISNRRFDAQTAIELFRTYIDAKVFAEARYVNHGQQREDVGLHERLENMLPQENRRDHRRHQTHEYQGYTLAREQVLPCVDSLT